MTAALWLLPAGCATLRKPKVVPDSVATCRQLSCDAVAAMQRGQWEEAHQLLNKAVSMSPADMDARRQLAEVLWQTGQRQEAAVQMETAVRLDPRHAPTVVRSGEMLLGLGAADRALARAEEAVALDPTLASAWALRGRVYRQQGKLEGALADMHQALRYSGNDAALLQDLAELQYLMDHPQRCLATLRHMLSTTPPREQSQQALWLEGLAYGKVNRHEDAAASLYAASLKGTPQPELLYQLAQAQSAAGRTQEALASARQALAANAQHAGSRELVAHLEGVATPGMEATLRR
ncbi:MAG: tetratricopeptide repeat protein [Pirellulales bacterium]|nr:tetratricopeptide repeat protein [Pirellulales bacterium]